ncbi:hypothetical protein SAMN04487851_11420 [Prevotella sp. tc2-28]|nr:hypothetical protein SAMN04487851_11420 [Prevotella sp. tc2-28]
MTDEQKTSYMRKVFKEMNIGDSFDYTECRKLYERMTEEKGGTHGVYHNPCIVLELFDPIMAPAILGWMYCNFDDNGDCAGYGKGSPAPLFGYNMVELTFDKGTLMGFSDSEKQILREAISIIGEKTKQKGEEA